MLTNYLGRQNKRLFIIICLIFGFYLIDGSIILLQGNTLELIFHSIFCLAITIGLGYIMHRNNIIRELWLQLSINNESHTKIDYTSSE